MTDKTFSAMAKLHALRTLLSRFRFRFANETELQEGIEKILLDSEFIFAREVPIGLGRLDFMVDADIAIETKIGGSANELMRQVSRYAQSDRIQGILVVTSRATHTLPESFNSKPVMVHSLLDGAF